MANKRSKGLILESRPVYVYDDEDAKARLRHQALMQDYQELEKEADVMRSRLEAARQRKLTLAAEVRFLRRRYKFLMTTKTMPVSEEQNFVQPPFSIKKTKNAKEHLLNRKESSHHRLQPAAPELKTKKKHHLGKDVNAINALQVQEYHPKKAIHSHGKEVARPNLIPVSALIHNGRINVRREAFPFNPTVLELTQKERVHVATNGDFRKSIAAFDLNLDTNPSPCAKEASVPSRAPIFDLNEISTGDEDFQSGIEAAKLEEAKKSLIRGLNEEQQNDLKLSICRNAGEGPSRVGKRKISWQDPVALRV